MNWLVLSWALTVGYLPVQADYIYSGGKVVEIQAPENTLSTMLEFQADAFDCFRAWTSMRSYQEFSYESIYMSPWRIDFKIGAELYYGPFAFGVWHECDHGINKYMNYLGANYARDTTEIYIAIRGKYRL